MRQHGQPTQQRGRAKRTFLVAATVALLGASSARAASEGGVVPTLSGLPYTPRVEGSLRVGRHGAAIRFASPTNASLAMVHVLWKRPSEGCRVALQENGGAALASASVPDGATGWTAIPLVAPLTSGTSYHLVVTCDPPSRSRLAYVRGAQAAGRCGGWAVEQVHGGKLRPRACGVAPVFALTFSDGTWWGQPYSPLRPGRTVRVCGKSQVSATLVPNRSVLLSDVRIPGARGVEFTLTRGDGAVVLSNVGPKATVTGAPASLAKGTPYTLRLRSRKGSGCTRVRAMVTDLVVGPGLGGIDVMSFQTSRDGGQTWRSFTGSLGLELATDEPSGSCGDACTGGSPSGGCGASCGPTEPAGGPACGNDVLDPGEECDGRATGTCTAGCTSDCRCEPTRSYKSIYTGGYLGVYDPSTVPVWPQRLGLILGAVDAQGPLIAHAKQVAAAAGNTDARFIFYLSLTTLDSQCNCPEEDLFQSISAAHPDFFLHDQNGNRVSNFIDQYGANRLFVVDVGNPAYVDAWVAFVDAKIQRDGWDGVFADNILRGNFYAYSAIPVNPRTGAPYTTEQYRQDILFALQRLRQHLDAEGKLIFGNHSNAWEADTFSDPVIQQQITTMHGVEVEDCVFGYDGSPHSETDWIAQLQYLDYANRHGVHTICNGSSGTIDDSSTRPFLLASYLLTKEGFSNIAELNTLGSWWDGYNTDLGAPLGPYTCLDPNAGFSTTSDCPSTGKVYARNWERGLVLANPSASTTVTVPLDQSLLLNGQQVRSVTLGPRSGVTLLQP